MAHDGAYLRPLSLIDPLVPRTSSWELGRQARRGLMHVTLGSPN